MTQTPERRRKSRRNNVAEQISTWSTMEIKTEVGDMIGDLEKARTRELAARIRNAEERTLEAETALQYRRDKVARIYKRYTRLLDELEARSETYP